jgi:transcriptional regulator with XRE-family HTH domain
MSSGKEYRLNSIDTHVGSRIRHRRRLLGMSQEGLGLAIGVTLRSVQKYEEGTTQIGASRLYDLARAMGVPVHFFFSETPDLLEAPSDDASLGDNALTSQETLELVGAYYRITDPAVRKKVIDLIVTMGLSEP